MAHGNVNIIKSIDEWEIKLVEAKTSNRVVNYFLSLNQLQFRNERAQKLCGKYHTVGN